MDLNKLIELNYKIEQAEEALSNLESCFIDTNLFYIKEDNIKDKQTFSEYIIESDKGRKLIIEMQDNLEKLEKKIYSIYERGLERNCKFSDLKTLADDY